MNRTHLERAAEALALKRGYTFFAVQDESLPHAVRSYPAAVLAPLAFHAIEGRQHGRATYDMTLRLLTLGAKLSPTQRCAALATLENDLLALFVELTADEKVIAVEELKIRSAALSLTPHGELSQTATARIITHF
ncbi:MAG: hypothetical protein RRZ83_02785 [Alistipes sp.]